MNDLCESDGLVFYVTSTAVALLNCSKVLESNLILLFRSSFSKYIEIRSMKAQNQVHFYSTFVLVRFYNFELFFFL